MGTAPWFETQPKRSKQVSQDDPMPTDHQHGFLPLDPTKQSKPSMKALAYLLERVASWLLAFGSWSFVGLIAFNLIVLSAIISIRPVDVATLIAITAFACALPLNVTGIFLLRLVKDMQDIGLEDLTFKAFQDAGFPDIEAYFPPFQQRQEQNRRRSRLSICYSLGILALTITITLTGFVAALWHVKSWIGVVLLATVILCTMLVIVVFAHSLSPESEAEKELKSRYREYRIQQGKKGVKIERALCLCRPVGKGVAAVCRPAAVRFLEPRLYLPKCGQVLTFGHIVS
jgi:hypothetical protein